MLLALSMLTAIYSLYQFCADVKRLILTKELCRLNTVKQLISGMGKTSVNYHTSVSTIT